MALIKCSECGRKISDKATMCPNCGAPIEKYWDYGQANPFYEAPAYPRKKFYTNTWFTILMLVCFFPIGIYLMLKYKTFNITGRIVVIALFCMGAIAAINNSTNNTVQTNQSKTSTTKVKQSEFQKITETTVEQEEKILEILKVCGIEKIKNIEHDELLDGMNINDEKGYRINSSDVNNIILYLTSANIVNIIRYADNDLYAAGEVVSTIQDYTFTLDEQTRLQTSCQDTVKTILKSPSTAKFPNITKWAFGKGDGEIVVQSYVDSQNSFGAELRSEFQFILSADDYTIKSLIFDGKEYIGQN